MRRIWAEEEDIPRLHSAHPLLQSLQRLITKNRLSPYAAMCVLQKQGHELDFCVKTLYNHIGRENFPIKREHLPHGCYRRRKSENLTPCRKHKNLKGESIDNRPESINARNEAGHHEMDLVVGPEGGRKRFWSSRRESPAISISYSSKTKLSEALSEQSIAWKENWEKIPSPLFLKV